MNWMKRGILILGVLAPLFGSVEQVKADIIYNLNSYLSEQNGWSLSGTITTDGNLGAITSADIISWQFTLTNGATTVSSSSPLAAVVTGILDATATSLTLPIAVGNTENALQLGNGFFDYPLVEWARGNAGPYPTGDWYQSRTPGTATYWTDNVPTGTLALPTAGQPFIIAGPIPATTTPEPASLTLFAIGIASVAGYGWRRRKLEGKKT